MVESGEGMIMSSTTARIILAVFILTGGTGAVAVIILRNQRIYWLVHTIAENAANRTEPHTLIFTRKTEKYFYKDYFKFASFYTKFSQHHPAAESLATDLSDFKELWMSRAPTRSLSEHLLDIFKSKSEKPTIYIAYIFRYTDEDRTSLENLHMAGFKIEPWTEVTERLPIYRTDVSAADGHGRKNITKYGVFLLFYTRELGNTHHADQLTERELQVVHIACAEDGVTHLLTDDGTLYRSARGGQGNEKHAEMEFIRSRKQTKTIKIKNSPCADCCDALMDYYKDCQMKPEIQFGRIYNLKNANEETEQFRKTVKLCQNGFNLEVWELFNNYMHSTFRLDGKRNTVTDEHINKVKLKAAVMDL